MEYVRIYDQHGQMLAVLDNAGEIAYELTHNDLWVGSFTLPANDPKNAYCAAHNLVTLPDGTRELGLYRIVAAPDSEAVQAGGKVTYEVEHVMATLLDDLLFGSYTLGGDMHAALETILACQTAARWRLGACEFSACSTQTFENTPLLTAMMALAETLDEEYTWDFDTSATPWTVNLRRADTRPGCGILYRRSLRGIRKSMDATSLVTRLYLLGSGEGEEQVTVKSVNGGLPYIDADTVGTWGVKCAVWTHKGITDPAELLRRGRLVLEQRKNPYISYEVDAIDLYRQTGDAWDNAMPGKMAAVMDTEDGISFQARVKKIRKTDTQGDPGGVTITIANAPRDIADVLTEEINRAIAAEQQLNTTVNENAKSTRASAAGLSARLNNVEFNLDDANARIELKAEKTTVSLLGERVSKAEIAIDGANARIDLKANQTDVTAIGERVSKAEIAIDGANARIDLKAEQSTVTDLDARMSSAEVAIDGANAAIALRVVKGDVATQLAVEAGNVSIIGGNLVIDGYVTADRMNAMEGNFTKLITGQTRATTINTSGLTVGSDMVFDGNAVEWSLWSIGNKTGNYLTKSGQAMTVTYADLPHYHAITCTENNGVVTITQGAVQAEAGSDSFNIADTKFYKDAIVSAKKSVRVTKNWEENICTCMPSDGLGTGTTITISQTTGTPTASAPNLYPITIKDGNTTVLSFTVNASARYTAGQNSVSVTKNWEDNVCTCLPSAGTGAGKTITLTQTTAAPTTSAPNLYRVTVKDGSTQVMYFTVDATSRYNAGVTAGKNAVTITKGSWNAGKISFTKSEGTASTKSVTLSKGTVSWNGNTASVPINDASGSSAISTGYTVTVDASARYNAGVSDGYSTGYSAGYTAGYTAGGGGASYTAKSYARYGALAYYDDNADKYVSAGYGYWFLSSNKTLYEKNS